MYLLGVDIGTYSSKGVLVREDGEVIATHFVEHQLEIPRPGWAEHDAEKAWWRGFLEVTRELLARTSVSASDIRAIGLSAISPAILPMDGCGRPLRKAILYGIDTRATTEIAELQAIASAFDEPGKAGVRLSSQSATPKILWIRRHEPEVWGRTRIVVSGTGFLLYRLTGQTAIDVYDAACFEPFVELQDRRWGPAMARHVAPESVLPPIRWTCDIAGRITREGARLSGLAEGTPVITGTADAAAEAVSAGLAGVGDMMIMYGSSTFFILRTSQLLRTSCFWCAPFLEKETYVLTGGMATAGSITRWFRDQFAPEEVRAERDGGENAYAALGRLAQKSPQGANGLVTLPYFSGERTPILDPHATGVIFGLGLSHTRADVYRSVLESVGFGIRHNIERMRDEGADLRRVLAVGGGTHNPLWMQIVSDIAGIEQHIPEQAIGAAYGDAFLAGIGAGVFGGLHEADRWVKTRRVVRPDWSAHRQYEKPYRIYRDLYNATAPLMALGRSHQG